MYKLPSRKLRSDDDACTANFTRADDASCSASISPTLGGIAAYAPGQLTAYWAAVRRRYGRLLLAGEHTDAYAGTMEGAARSGRRAAAAIDALL